RRLRWIDDRGEPIDAERPKVRDSDRRAAERVAARVARAHRGLEPLSLVFESGESLRLGVAYDRHDETGVERDRDTDVDLLGRDQRIAVDTRTEPRVRAQRFRRGGHDHVRVRRTGGLAPTIRTAHVHVARDGELRCFVDAARHRLSDGAAHATEGLALLGHAIPAGRGARSGRPAGGRLDVLDVDATLWPGPADARDVHAELLRALARGRRG